MCLQGHGCEGYVTTHVTIPKTSQLEPTRPGPESRDFSRPRFKLIARRVAGSIRGPICPTEKYKNLNAPSFQRKGVPPFLEMGVPNILRKKSGTGADGASGECIGSALASEDKFGWCLNPVLPLIPTEVNLDKEAKGTDALRGISIPRISKSPVLFRVLRRWYWNSALRVLLTELNNLPSRMRWALEIHAWELGGYRGQPPTQLSVTANSQCRICRPVYISHMQQLSNLQPTHTVVDSYLVSQAW